MAEGRPTPVLFLDLDGTLIKGKDDLGHFIKGPHEVELYDGVFDRLKTYKALGYRLVLISNQGGIAMRHIDESTVIRIMEEVHRLTGRMIDGMMWCVHHPDAKGETIEETRELSQCFCRKPSTTLLTLAMSELTRQYPNEYYRPWACIFIGDMRSDEECAKNAGIAFMHAKDWRETDELAVPAALILGTEV